MPIAETHSLLGAFAFAVCLPLGVVAGMIGLAFAAVRAESGQGWTDQEADHGTD